MTRRDALQIVHPLQFPHLYLAARVVLRRVHQLAFVTDFAGDDVHMLVVLIVVFESNILAFLEAHSFHILLRGFAPLVVAQSLSRLQGKAHMVDRLLNVLAQMAGLAELSGKLAWVRASHVPPHDLSILALVEVVLKSATKPSARVNACNHLRPSVLGRDRPAISLFIFLSAVTTGSISCARTLTTRPSWIALRS